MPAFLLALSASACIDNGNDVGYRLAQTHGGAGSGAEAGAGAASGSAVMSGGAPSTTLPPLPQLTGVKADVTGDSVSITLLPFDDAVDYRVYALPQNRDISLTADGGVTVKNAIYRCAGRRQAPPVALDGAAPLTSGYMKTLVDGQDVNGYTRSLAEATLGHVYLESGKDRRPVYALGDSDPAAENENYFMRWTASRVKEYVTTAAQRDALLARGFRDDGVAFYVP